jgi:hypothetical protein
VSKNQSSYPLTVTIDRSILPSAIETLKDMVCDYARIIEHQARTIGEQTKTIADQAVAINVLTARVNQLEERYDKLARLHFGQSSEKQSTLKSTPETSFTSTRALLTEPNAPDRQGEMENQANTPGTNTPDTETTEATKKQKTRTSQPNHNGRNPFASHLTRQTMEHDLTVNEKVCKTCGSFLSLIGFEEREQLESAIEKYIVLVHRRRKYACKNKHCTCQTIITAPTPFEPIEKGLAGPHLLAEVIVDK